MARTIDTIAVPGTMVELDIAKKRRPDMRAKCKGCGGEIGSFPFIRVEDKQAGYCYIHRHCADPFRRPPMPRTEVIGKATNGKYRWAVELEAMYKDDNRVDTNAWLLANCGLWADFDSTVNVEYHHANRVNFHGVHDWLASIADKVDLTTDESGQHINMSKWDWTRADVDSIGARRTIIFGALRDHMEENRNETIEHWGRYFTDYAERDFYSCYTWINPKTNRLEYRLAKFRNPKQFSWLIMLCGQFTDILDDFVKGRITDEKASKRILRAYEKHCKGTAPYHMKHRNKGA